VLAGALADRQRRADATGRKQEPTDENRNPADRPSPGLHAAAVPGRCRELDVQFLAGEVLVNSDLRLRRNPAAVPGQALQLDGHGLETISVAIDGSPSPRTTTAAPIRY
jgi:hypothetical protein